MPLPPTVEREEVHQRRITMKAYRRADGLFDIEAHLRDTKPFPFDRVGRTDPLPPGEPQHDLSLRFVVDRNNVVKAVDASSDATPFAICPQAGASLQALVGVQIGKGWSKLVRERLARVDNCTHLMELLNPLATVALMGTRALKPVSERFPSNAPPKELNTCYAWSTERAEVKRMFPMYHTPKD